MKKFVFLSLISFCVVLFSATFFPLVSQAFSQQGVLPQTTEHNTAKECNNWDTFNLFYDQGYDSVSQDKMEELLGCAIRTGRVRLFMVPFFITRLIELLISVAGLVAMLFIVIGGYKFVTGGISDDKEAGKKTVLHAIIGLVVALSSYILINFIQTQLTQ